MHIVKRIKKKLHARRNHVDIKKTQELSDYFRKEVIKAETLELLGSKNFESLANVALYAEPGIMGVWTAIQAAFCMGYKAGREKI